mgnify:CR=1 FL=1
MIEKYIQENLEILGVEWNGFSNTSLMLQRTSFGSKLHPTFINNPKIFFFFFIKPPLYGEVIERTSFVYSLADKLRALLFSNVYQEKTKEQLATSNAFHK